MYFCWLSSNKKRVIFLILTLFPPEKCLFSVFTANQLSLNEVSRLFAGFGTYKSVENLGSFGNSTWNRTNVEDNVQPQKDLRSDAINYLFSWLISVSYVDL